MTAKKAFQTVYILLFLSAIPLTPNQLWLVVLPPLFKVVFALCFITSIIAALFFNQSRKSIARLNNFTRFFFMGVFLYYVGILIGSIAVPEGFSMYRLLAGKVFPFISLILFLYLINITKGKLIRECMNLYTKVFLLFSVLCIILFTGIYFNFLQPIEVLEGYQTGRFYLNYGLGLVEERANVSLFSGYFVPRMMSFYNEPGTFAMMLTPAILWSAFSEKNIIKFLVMMLALILTFSVGGIITLSFTILALYACIFIYSKRASTIQLSIIFLKYLFILLILFWSFLFVTSFFSEGLQLDFNVISNYVVSKFSVAGSTASSSAGVRLQEIPLAFQLLAESPQGFGANVEIDSQFGTISVGIVRAMLESGVLGSIGYWVMHLSVILAVFRSMTLMSPQNSTLLALSTSILSLELMSWQRSELFSFHMSMFMLAMFIHTYNYSLSERKQLRKFSYLQSGRFLLTDSIYPERE